MDLFKPNRIMQAKDIYHECFKNALVKGEGRDCGMDTLEKYRQIVDYP